MAACIHEQLPQPPEADHPAEHPIVAVLAVIAIVVAILLIMWARFEVHGTGDIEATLDEAAPAHVQPEEQRELEAAVTANRFATGLSP
jgi:hypothetical protein